ncbi:MAG TPA: hypothetical protein VHC19_09390, partial [Pirellulales bacterium]|nr:hypothetical protein [Pirellulales bacterium]
MAGTSGIGGESDAGCSTGAACLALAASTSRWSCSACCCKAASTGLTFAEGLFGGVDDVEDVKAPEANQPVNNETARITAAPPDSPAQMSGERLAGAPSATDAGGEASGASGAFSETAWAEGNGGGTSGFADGLGGDFPVADGARTGGGANEPFFGPFFCPFFFAACE